MHDLPLGASPRDDERHPARITERLAVLHAGRVAAITYYVALPILRSEEGDWIAGEAVEAQTSSAAKSRAEALARKHGGAVAFSRTGDPQSGEFEDATVIAKFGQAPEDLRADG